MNAFLYIAMLLAVPGVVTSQVCPVVYSITTPITGNNCLTQYVIYATPIFSGNTLTDIRIDLGFTLNTGSASSVSWYIYPMSGTLSTTSSIMTIFSGYNYPNTDRTATFTMNTGINCQTIPSNILFQISDVHVSLTLDTNTYDCHYALSLSIPTAGLCNVCPPVNPPVAAPVDPPVNPPVAAPVDPPVNPPVNPPVDPPVDAPVNPPVAPIIKSATMIRYDSNCVDKCRSNSTSGRILTGVVTATRLVNDITINITTIGQYKWLEYFMYVSDKNPNSINPCLQSFHDLPIKIYPVNGGNTFIYTTSSLSQQYVVIYGKVMWLYNRNKMIDDMWLNTPHRVDGACKWVPSNPLYYLKI